MFFDGTAYVFERSSKSSASTFGGPFEFNLESSDFLEGPHPLHLVARLSMNLTPELWSRCPSFDLPLIYGFNYDGCEIKYQFSFNSIEILEMWPKKYSDDFPYSNYPLLLPYVPLQLAETRPVLVFGIRGGISEYGRGAACGIGRRGPSPDHPRSLALGSHGRR